MNNTENNPQRTRECREQFVVAAALKRKLPEIEEDLSPDAILDFARLNEVEMKVLEKLASLKPGYYSNLYANRLAYGARYEAEMKVMARINKDSGSKLLVIKSPEVQRTFGDDLDVLSSGEETFEELKDKFENAGYRYFPSLMTFKEPGKYFFLRQEDGFTTGLRPRIHLHTQMGWMGVEFFDKRRLWERKRDKKGVPVTSREDSVAIFAAHAVYEVGWIKLGELIDVAEHLKKGADLEPVRREAMREGWINGFDTFFGLARAFAEKIEMPLKLADFKPARRGWTDSKSVPQSPRITRFVRLKSWAEKLGYTLLGEGNASRGAGLVLLQSALQRNKCPW